MQKTYRSIFVSDDNLVPVTPKKKDRWVL